MRRIDIDDEVYLLLERNSWGFAQPNAVLRVLLGLDDTSSVPTDAPLASSSYVSGKLLEQINDKLIAAGDILVHHQQRLGKTYRAVVEADGWISTDLRRYKSPSAALRALVGTEISGWANWTHERSGKTLRQLRDEVHPND